MIAKSKIFIQLFLLFYLFATDASASYLPVVQDTLKAEAISLFESGEFKKATPLFKELIDKDPDNDMLNYYYGACLAEQDIFTDETNQYLLKAVSGNTPDKIFYYVGKYFHSKELWNSAIKYYNRFSNYATEEEKQKVGIDKLIEYCYNKVKPDSKIPDTLSITDSQTPDELTESQTDSTEAEIISVPLTEKPESNNESFIPIHFRINTTIEYLKPGQFKNQEAYAYFTMGKETEDRISKVISESDSLRKQYSRSSANREQISDRILKLEQESYELNDEATVFFDKARELENSYWVNAGENEINRFMEETREINQLAEKKSEIKEEPLPFKEINPELLVQDNPVEKTKPVEQDENEITFRIQIGAFSRNLPDYIDRLYKKLSLIRKIDNYTDDRGVTVYTTGNLTNFEDAVKMQSQVRQEGVKDAFVVAYKNGERITLSEAKKILNIK
ncbi:MAG: SPOR domain-containing protein [Prolixibacteraceae bacterium]|nr:SPOR domain-containing protein [Prolixibacteraceae bacterium]MBN2775753.1 SPOR domain-containing protein [Prolixibacteraceae bacterium]